MCSCFKGFPVGPGSCVPTISPITGGSSGPVGEWVLCPAVAGEGFVSSVPSQIVPRPYSLMYYLFIRWRVGQGGREEAGEGKGLCWQHRGSALSQLLFPAPSHKSQVGDPAPAGSCSQSVQHWLPSPEQGTALPVCPRLRLFRGWAENA